MTTEAQPMAIERTRVARLTFTVRAAYADGVVHYYRVGGVSNGEDAMHIAREQAELERPGVAIFTSQSTSADEHPVEGDE